MRATAWPLVLVFACSGRHPGDDVVDPPPDPKGYTLAIDMAGLDRFVQPATATSWPVAGTVTASEGLASIAVAGTDLGASTSFTTTVPVAPGLTRIPILATDLAGHTRKGDRSLLAARLSSTTRRSRR
jgi:hypothetical protein